MLARTSPEPASNHWNRAAGKNQGYKVSFGLFPSPSIIITYDHIIIISMNHNLLPTGTLLSWGLMEEMANTWKGVIVI